MNIYNPKIHNRRSIRLKGYDYSQEGLYFITLCIQDRIHLFGEIKDGEMILNKFGTIAEEEWLKTPKIRDNITLGDFIIMPDHIHGIIQIDYQIKNNNQQIGEFKSPSNSIGAIIRGYKGATTKRINSLLREERKNISTGVLQYAPTNAPTKSSIWQRNYYESIIKNEKAFNNISNYIINNPENWDTDKFYK